MHFTRIVLLDGIAVPAQSVSCAWSVDGMSQASITLVPSYPAQKIFPGTHVHVFHAETGLFSLRRTAVEIPTTGDVAENVLWLEQSVATIGERFLPVLDLERGRGRRGTVLLDSMPYHGFHYRWGGEVISVEMSESANQGAVVVLQCRGYEHLAERVQAIQLTRGQGTFSEQERRFFGQQRPFRVGRGRNAFYDGISDIFASTENDFAGGLRRLMTEYAALVNDMWNNRFAWARLQGQVVSVDGDETVSRLMDTRALQEFLREQLQQLYLVPLRKCIDLLLEVPRYKMLAIPTPAFFPLVPEREPQFRTEQTEESYRARDGALYALVSWPGRDEWVEPDPGDLDPPEDPTILGELFRDGSFYRYRYTGTDGNEYVVDAVRVQYPGGDNQEFPITNNDRTLTINPDPQYNGGGASYVITLDGATTEVLGTVTGSSRFPGEEVFEEGLQYFFSEDNVGTGQDLYPPHRLVFDVRVRRRRGTVRTRTVETQVEVEPGEQEDLWSNDVQRLTSYAFLPELWWAVPPACNVITPDELRSFSIADPGMNKMTRLMGKIAPGRSGSSRVLLDKFAAPSSDDLNVSVEAADDDLLDATNLTRSEYISGVVADVYYFDSLARLVREEEWEPYLRSFFNAQFWSMRLGAVTASLTVRTTIQPVVGAPMLVIRGSRPPRNPEGEAERNCLLRRLSILQRNLARLRRCRSSLRSGGSGAERLQSYIQALINLRRMYGDAQRASAVSDNINDLSMHQVSYQLRTRYLGDVNSPEAEERFAQTRSGSRTTVESRVLRDNPRNLSANPNGITIELVDRYIGDPEARVLVAPDGHFQGGWPSEDKMRRWFNAIPDRVRDNSGCASVLDRDIALIEDAIDATRDALRALGAAPATQHSVIGYVASVQESAQSGAEQMTIQLTHVRSVGEDLDWDGLDGDDVESLVTFGTNGYMDEKYSISRIGAEVYEPIFGCRSIADLPDVQQYIQELESREESLADNETVGALPCDASDILSQLTSGSCCSDDTVEGPGASQALTTTSACQALIQTYFDLQEAGVDSDGIEGWLKGLRNRATMTLADAYRDSPIVLLDKEGLPSVVSDLTRDDSAVYGATQPSRGFFADSFIGPEFDIDRVRVQVGEDTLPLSENEQDLLQSRTQAVIDVVESLSDRTFSRSG